VELTFKREYGTTEGMRVWLPFPSNTHPSTKEVEFIKEKHYKEEQDAL